MNHLNEKGFALVETLIVSVFVLAIFTTIYANFFPIMGEYERRENYDDIESVYNTYLIKRMIETNESTKGNLGYNFAMNSGVNNKDYWKFTCAAVDSSDREYCQNLFDEAGVVSIYLASYNISGIKTGTRSNSLDTEDPETADYLKTLPNFSNDSNNYISKDDNRQFIYRIIVKYSKTVNFESSQSSVNSEKTIYSFSTMGVGVDIQ